MLWFDFDFFSSLRIQNLIINCDLISCLLHIGKVELVCTIYWWNLALVWVSMDFVWESLLKVSLKTIFGKFFCSSIVIGTIFGNQNEKVTFKNSVTGMRIKESGKKKSRVISSNSLLMDNSVITCPLGLLLIYWYLMVSIGEGILWLSPSYCWILAWDPWLATPPCVCAPKGVGNPSILPLNLQIRFYNN